MLLTLAVDYLAELYAAIGPKEPTLNPHIPAEYRSHWFLTPEQHALETICFGIFYSIIAFFAHKRVIQSPQWKNLAPARVPTASDWFLAFLAATSYAVAFYYKYITPGCWRLAYMLQPCHVLTGSFAILSILPGRMSNYIFQLCVTLTWSSVIAIVFPDLSDYEHWPDMFNYWYEHALILILPILLCVNGRFVYLGDMSFLILGYMTTTIYHCIVLQVACLATEVNIATMASPPDMLAHLGLQYRALQYGICCALHVVYNLLIIGAHSLLSSSKHKVE